MDSRSVGVEEEFLLVEPDTGRPGTACGPAERRQDDGSPQALGHVRGDPPDHVDLAVVEAVLRVLAVQAHRAPALPAADEPEFRIIPGF